MDDLMNASIYQYGHSLILELQGKEKKAYGEIAPLKGWSQESLKEALKQLMRILTQGVHEDLYPSVSFGVFSAFASLKEEVKKLPKIPVKFKQKVGELSINQASAI